MTTSDDIVCNFETPSTYVFDLSNTMSRHNFMLCYKGDFSQNMIKSILSMTEKKLNNSEEDVLVKKKVFNVLVECLQTISKSDIAIEGEHSLLMIGKAAENYEIYTGNLIPKNKKTELAQLLHSISSYGKDELKRVFKLLMTSDKLFHNNSIEIALIDIAKKTGNKIEFDFKDLDDDTSFFSLKTIITREN